MSQSNLVRSDRLKLISILLFSIISLDQVTKIIAKETLIQRGILSYFGDVFRFQYMENTGAFLGLGSGLTEPYRFLVFSMGVLGCLIGALVFLLIRINSLNFTIGLTLVVAGGVGNLIDRFVYGHVIDFMNMGIYSLRTGVFNVADMAIMAGIGFLLFDSFVLDQRKSGKKVKN